MYSETAISMLACDSRDSADSNNNCYVIYQKKNRTWPVLVRTTDGGRDRATGGVVVVVGLGNCDTNEN